MLVVTPRAARCTIDELLADVVTDYEVNAKRLIKDLRRRIDKHGGRSISRPAP